MASAQWPDFASSSACSAPVPVDAAFAPVCTLAVDCDCGLWANREQTRKQSSDKPKARERGFGIKRKRAGAVNACPMIPRSEVELQRELQLSSVLASVN